MRVVTVTGNRQPTRDGVRAFTLLEVVVVATVASVIFLILLRWLATLAGVAGAVAESTVPARNGQYTEYRLANDLGSATVCDPVAGNAIRTLNERDLELYVNGRHQDGSRGIQMVRWRGADGVLTRTAWDVSVDSNCLPVTGSNASARVIAAEVYTGAKTPFFVAQTAGVDLGTCKTVTRPVPGTQSVDNPNGIAMSTPEGDGCFPANIRATVAFLNAGQDTNDSASWDSSDSPSRMDRIFTLPENAGGTS